MGRICIYDGREVSEGYPVKEDFVIRSIAFIKKKLGNYKGNKLYVCKEHYEEWKKRRKNFKNSLILSSIVVAVILIFSLISLFSNFSLSALANFLFVLFALAVILFLFPLISYTPDVGEFEKVAEGKGKAGARKEKREGGAKAKKGARKLASKKTPKKSSRKKGRKSSG